MTRLPYSSAQSDGEVIGLLRSHLLKHDSRFTGNSRAAKRRLRRADAAANGVLDWWNKEGMETYSAFRSDRTTEDYAAAAEPYVQSAIGVIGGFFISLFASLAMRWVEKLVTDLLIDWLTNFEGANYRSACMARSEAP